MKKNDSAPDLSALRRELIEVLAQSNRVLKEGKCVTSDSYKALKNRYNVIMEQLTALEAASG